MRRSGEIRSVRARVRDTANDIIHQRRSPDDAARELDELRDELVRLEEILRPFVGLAAQWDHDPDRRDECERTIVSAAETLRRNVDSETSDVDWCEIYVDGAADVSALVALVEAAVRGQADGTSVMSPDGVEIDVGTNSTNPRFEPLPPAETDFTFWPFVIDLDVDEERGVGLVSAVLRALWNQELRAVAACSFEERLPRSGGSRAGQLILDDE